MTVDAKRLEAVFQSALAAADSTETAALLDRECGSNLELRQRVEALLDEYDDSTCIVEPPEVRRVEGDRTVVDGPEGTGPRSLAEAARERAWASDENAAKGKPDEGEGAIPLDFLQPTAKPESLGRLGYYEVLDVLGRGAFGIVVRAFDEKLHRVVAIKVLTPHLAASAPARRRFLREARASAGVRHDNFVQIYAVEEQPLPYLVMEYIPGQTLEQRLEKFGPLNVLEVLRIGEQIARGLAAAHAQGLVHRDIKPANILLERGVEQKVKITDFGLARAVDDASLTQSGYVAGTPLYMAPEQATGEPVDHRADLFSLGSVLYTMLGGQPPFRAPTSLAVMKRVTEDKPRSLREIAPDVPKWLCDLIDRLHAKDPAKRFPSAAELADLLGRYRAHLLQPSLFPRPETARGRWQKMLAIVTAVVIIAAVAAMAFQSDGFRRWRDAAPETTKTGVADSGQDSMATTVTAEHAVPPAPIRRVLQDPAVVQTALIDFHEPDRRFGGEAHDNPIRRAEQCNAFLVHFDLDKLGAPPRARVVEATVSFCVWDPSVVGQTKVCVFPLKRGWDEATATWRQPSMGEAWANPAGFTFGADTGPAERSAVVVTPEQGSDTADPPIEYQLDVTNLVRAWLEGGTPNYGVAIAPVIDPSVDDGLSARFQVFGSRHGRAQYIPKLTVRFDP